MKQFLIGSYAAAGTDAVFLVTLEEKNGTMTAEPVTAEVEQPSWLTASPDRKVIYTVEEQVPDGRIAALKQDENGRWRVAVRLRAGSAPCHLTLDERHEFLFASNYMDGSLSVYRLDGEGLPTKETDRVRHQGHGPREDRQEGPHVHCGLWADNLLYCTDLGLDRVFAYRLDRRKGRLEEDHQIAFPAGCGPRHLACHPGHPKLLYVNAELGGQVFTVNRETREIIQTVQALPEPWRDDFRVSSLKFDGDILYVGSREREAVILFRKGQDGTLGEPHIYAHRQKTPRDVWMGGEYCLTADEGSGSLTLLQRDGLELRERVCLPIPGAKPTCILPWEG